MLLLYHTTHLLTHIQSFSTYSCYSEQVEHFAAVPPRIGIAILCLAFICNINSICLTKQFIFVNMKLYTAWFCQRNLLKKSISYRSVQIWMTTG